MTHPPTPQWDANDIRLVQAFYELKPTEEQVLYY